MVIHKRLSLMFNICIDHTKIKVISVQKRVNDYLGFGYDSALVQQDYYSLFRDRRYSGLDRISSANQVTVGGTTRFYDKKCR